ncbi:serine/threonine protein kinase [Pyxidicoccus xibeiensis]|uniref:serine/threonine protein kinase n=1 Tax=Pyxidicoccus xibeiensis TaxID=2906759 RepID=UPI0020A7E2D1|nr:serine/threonine-protein kinase [Pyxidicoccus xibeiensis]MCP3144311.1 serine/threonine protein kinase [Pyxidicoccus xibeiensis]
MQPGYLNPARLPLGTRVGPWRVLERIGLGTYGAVYRAIDAQDSRRIVALKLALHPGDERFAREGELLSRLRHPSVPRLVDQGVWQQPAGPCYPYLAMQWVDGASLYDWALQRRPTSRQVLHVLASLARALEATHAAGGVHRDVKGDNILVSDAQGSVFLTDFGSGHYLGAATLTPPPFPPGTPAYRSPEAWRSVKLPLPASAAAYAPGPADDVFALGVTAFRLITDEYPPRSDPTSLYGHEAGAASVSARAVNGRCCEELSELTSRMLSASPKARGSARELAEALEDAAHGGGPEADVPLFAPEAPPPEETSAAPRHVVHRAPGATWSAWLTAASLGLALGSWWGTGVHRAEEAEQVRASAPEEERDGGTVAVGDAALTALEHPDRAPAVRSSIALELPPKPFPGQRRPDGNMRCPGKTQVPINGGCWLKLSIDPKDCAKEDGYVYQGGCYTPALRRERPATSGPTKRTDGP